MKFYRAKFFDLADHLVESDNLDDDQLLRLGTMVKDIDISSSFQHLYKAVAEVDRLIRSDDFKSEGRPTSAEWAELSYNYFLAISYLRFVRGWVLRAMLASVLNPRAGTTNTDAIDNRVHRPLHNPRLKAA